MVEDVIFPTEYDFSEEDVVLDPYNSDINLIIDKECLLANPLSTEGFSFIWAGCRATYGVFCDRAAFEVYLTDHCECEDLLKDDQESYNYAIRVGWSLDTCSLQLGMDDFSFAYCSNGKKLKNSVYEDYGESFQKSDSVAAYIDFESNSNELIVSFSKNGVDMGVAFTIKKNDLVKDTNEPSVFYPHILSKNIVFEVNFGQRVSLLGDEPFAPLKSGFELMQKYTLDKRVRGELAPKEKKDCEVIMLVGLPGSGKTYWAQQHRKNNPKKQYIIIGISSIMDKMKTYESKKRRLSSSNSLSTQNNAISSTASKLNAEQFEKASKCMNKLIQFASQQNRNIILDQYNVYASSRRRKMSLFEGYIRKAVVIVPNDELYKERIRKAENEENKEFSISMIHNMKASFNLPKVGNLFDFVEYVELNETKSVELVEKYNLEGPNLRLQVILNKRSKHNDENRQNDPRAAATAIRLQRSGYGYGKESKFYRNPFQSHKRPIFQQPQMNRFGQPYGYGVQPQPNVQWPSAFPAIQNDWMPALPINPYQVPSHLQHQNISWQAQQQAQWTVIQQQQQAIQHDSWAPAMATNVTNQNNNSINNQK